MFEPILTLRIDTGTDILDYNACNYGLGATLSQQQSRMEKVIAYSSLTMSKPELRYEPTRKEYRKWPQAVPSVSNQTTLHHPH